MNTFKVKTLFAAIHYLFNNGGVTMLRPTAGTCYLLGRSVPPTHTEIIAALLSKRQQLEESWSARELAVASACGYKTELPDQVVESHIV